MKGYKMYKLKLYIFKTKLLIKKIINRTCWILDCCLELKAYNYRLWLDVERVNNLIKWEYNHEIIDSGMIDYLKDRKLRLEIKLNKGE
tara:strand:+ start:67 stop:330 length:264 start_codon:yes stop_codon:yes gene_type:complete